MAPQVLAAAPDGACSEQVAARVATARKRQRERQGVLNAALDGDGIDRHCALDAAASSFLQNAAARLGWSARGFHRVLRLARTIADLAAEPTLSVAQLAEAIQYRRVLPGQ